MFEPSKEDVEKYGMTASQRIFELMALAIILIVLAGFFLKILFF